MNQQEFDFRSKSESAQAQVATLPRFPEEQFKGYENVVKNLNAHLDYLATTISSSGLIGDELHAAKWREISEATEQAVILRLKKALVEHPELATSVKRAQELFRTEREIGPIVQQMNAEYSKVRDHIINNRYFAAKEALEQFVVSVTDGQKKIESTGIDPEFANPAVSTLEEWRLKAIKLFANVTRSFPVSYVIKKHFEDEGRSLARECSDATKRLQLNCELFSFVFRTPVNEIAKMNSAQLKFLEEQILLIRQGQQRGKP